MKTKSLIILMLALALPACILHAQDQNGGNPPPPSENDGPHGGGPGGRGHHRPPPMPLIQALDTNHDGVLSADEIANAPANLLKLDKNGDGQLTKDEYLPPRPPRRAGDTNGPAGGPPPDNQNDSGQPPRHRPLPPIVTVLDTNGDGIISADEIANASASLLKLDKNGVGQLTRDELMGPRPPRDGNGPGPDGAPNGQRLPPPDQNQ
jgi:hypothetical protein